MYPRYDFLIKLVGQRYFLATKLDSIESYNTIKIDNLYSLNPFGVSKTEKMLAVKPTIMNPSDSNVYRK